MSNDTIPDVSALERHITDGSKDLFFERAKWVQTWIMARAFPFIALLTLALSYYQIGSGRIEIPRTWSLVVAGAMLAIVLLRAFPYVLQRQWPSVFGNYQICLSYLGLMLLLGDRQGEHSLLYWGVLLLGFWVVGYLYPKKWLMPGELAAIAVMSTSVVMYGYPPLPDWVFVLCMVAPVMVYLQLKYQLLKPVLFLAALLVGVLLVANISGWQTFLAVLAALVLLGVAVYSILKLTQKDASSFIQSVGLGVVSGLLFLIVVVLGGMEPDLAQTWWLMFVLFSGVTAFLYLKNGSKLFALLMLWLTHWAFITLSFSWEEWLLPVLATELSGAEITAIMASLFLRHLAIRMDINRLLVWARIYLVLIAGISTVYLGNEAEMSLLRLLFLLAVFALALRFAQVENLAKGPPWWKGVVNPRHVVAIRRIMRKGGKFIGSIPFIGATIAAFIRTIQVIAKLKRDGRTIHSGDILIIIWVLFLAVFISVFIDVHILSDNIVNDISPGGVNAIESARSVMVSQFAYLIAGVLFGIVAIKEHQPLYPLLAMVSFLLAPATIIAGEYSMTAFFWLVSLIAATGILSVRELNKQP